MYKPTYTYLFRRKPVTVLLVRIVQPELALAVGTPHKQLGVLEVCLACDDRGRMERARANVHNALLVLRSWLAHHYTARRERLIEVVSAWRQMKGL